MKYLSFKSVAKEGEQPADAGLSLSGIATKKQVIWLALTLTVGALLLFNLSTTNFHLYHFAIETVSIVVAVTIFSIGWHTRNYASNPLHLVIAVGYLFVGLSDAFHLAYFQDVIIKLPESMEGMTTEFWMVARIFETAATFLAVLFLARNRKVDGWKLMITASAIWFAAITLVLTGNFPQTFVTGMGVTFFSVGAIHLFTVVNVITAILLWFNLRRMESNVVTLLIVALALMIAGDLCVTFYVDLVSQTNFFGHLLKFLAYLCLYRALVIGSLVLPYHTLFLDLTNRELAARKAIKAAELASREKSAFMASVSHELRTPMNSIIGLSSLLMRTKLTPLQRRYAAMTGESARTLVSLINEILDFSSLEERRMTVEKTPFVVRDLVWAVVEMFRLSGLGSGTEIKCEIADGAPPMVLGDPARLRQVLVNLVGNAVKYTKEGVVRVEVEPLTAGKSVTLSFSVSDTGPGIAEEDIPKLFMPYSHLHSDSAAEMEGAGLGLAISKSIVELMGGTITVESKVGEGSTFTFTAVLELAEGTNLSETPVIGEREPYAAGFDFYGLRALVADDNEINRIVTADSLKSMGFEVVTVANGREAMEAAVYDSFDVILMDVRMPEMDGLEATRELRAREITIPILGLTAAAFDDDREKCFAAGMDRYLAKPVEDARIREVLGEMLGVSWHEKPGRSAKEDADADFMRFIGKYKTNPVKFIEISGMFMDDCAQHGGNLARSLEEGDYSAASDIAHSLRGCLTVFGASNAAEMTRNLEKELKKGDVAAARGHLESIGAELEFLRICLEREISGLRLSAGPDKLTLKTSEKA